MSWSRDHDREIERDPEGPVERDGDLLDGEVDEDEQAELVARIREAMRREGGEA